MLDSTAAVAAERQGKNARQLLESVALQTGDEGIAISVITVLELAHGITRADTNERCERHIVTKFAACSTFGGLGRPPQHGR